MAGPRASSDDDALAEHELAGPAARRCRSLSPFSAAETVRRLESAALRHGLAVFACLAARPGRFGSDWLVLGVDATHTPVLRTGPEAAIELPLALRVAPRADRASDVEFSDSAWLVDHAELPREWAQQLAEIPQIVGEALRR
ncbi:MAG TPA: hypothetical protein VIO33_16750 [Burkholderiaceae bacterium]